MYILKLLQEETELAKALILSLGLLDGDVKDQIIVLKSKSNISSQSGLAAFSFSYPTSSHRIIFDETKLP